MTYLAESIALQSRFDTLWNNETPVQWPNVAFSLEDKTEWVRFTILSEPARQAAMGGNNSNLYRHPGFVSIQIFVKPNTGIKRALELADMVTNVWRGAQFSGITMGAPSVIPIGVQDGWYQVNVLCSYYRDEVLSRSS